MGTGKGEAESNIEEVNSRFFSTYENDSGEFAIRFQVIEPPIFGTQVRGYARVEDAKEALNLTAQAHATLRNQFGLEKLYFLVDLSEFSGTTWKAKMHFQTWTKKLFENGHVAHLCLIQPSEIVKTMIFLAKVINPALRLSVHDGQTDAEEHILKLIALENGVGSPLPSNDENLVDIPTDTLGSNGTSIPFIQDPNWRLELTGGHKAEFLLLNNEVVVYRDIGKFSNPKDAKKIAKTLLKVIESTGRDQLIYVVDFSELKSISLKSRKALASQLEKYRPYWKFKYYIFRGFVRTMYWVYSQLNPSVKANSMHVGSLQEAIKCYLDGNPAGVTESSVEDSVVDVPAGTTDYSSLSKDELITALTMKEQQLRRLSENQKSKLDDLFGQVSRISWDENFTPTEPKFNDDKDAFALLANAISLLEYDVYEMVQDLKNFSATLENKVKARTKELENQNRELLKVNSELDSFIYSTSHDLRAPLVSVMGLVDLVKNAKPEEKERYMGLISSSIERMDRLIRDITNFSRNARQGIEISEVNFRKMIDSIFEDLNYIQDIAIEKRIRIKQTQPFLSDGRRLKMIFNNLLSNAVRYHKSTHEPPWIEVSVEVTKKKAKIVVEDNGEGISNQYVSRIFDMFFRASHASRGSGLGLYIVKEAVVKLGGTIDVSSEVRKGTRFEIAIPQGTRYPKSL